MQPDEITRARQLIRKIYKSHIEDIQESIKNAETYVEKLRKMSSEYLDEFHRINQKIDESLELLGN